MFDSTISINGRTYVLAFDHAHCDFRYVLADGEPEHSLINVLAADHVNAHPAWLGSVVAEIAFTHSR